MSLSSDSQWKQYSGVDKKSLSKERNGFSNCGESSTQRQSCFSQPTGLPWNIQDMSWSMRSQPPNLGVVEFTATPFDVQNRNLKNNVLHCKRKAEALPDIPSKQLITEEKMSAYFDGMHISSEYPSTSGSTQAPECEGSMELDEAGVAVGSRLKGRHRLVLSEEMLRIRCEPIIPEALMQRLEKPCTSLVLWQPPKRILSSPEPRDPNNNPDREGKRQSVLVSSSANMDMEM